MNLSINNVRKAFETCEYPFYKNLKINENEATCTIYSIKSDYRADITLELSSFDKIIHQISIELIKLRSHEMIVNQTAIQQAEGITINLH